MKTYTLFRHPVCTFNTSFVLFESFLESRAYAVSHPDMMEEEIEAASVNEARRLGKERVEQLIDEYEHVAMEH